SSNYSIMQYPKYNQLIQKRENLLILCFKKGYLIRWEINNNASITLKNTNYSAVDGEYHFSLQSAQVI
uniref:hypothetical protein n=1 Tax=Algoriphagus sp. TaxID=1872435 RepID=UPI004048075C